MSVKEDLIAMREWLTPPGRWCQGMAWRDKAGHYCDTREQVVSACLYGAFIIAHGEQNFFSNKIVGTPRYEDMMDVLNGKCGGVQHYRNVAHSFVEFNDTPGRKQEEILALLDRCIADCEDIKETIAPMMERELEPA